MQDTHPLESGEYRDAKGDVLQSVRRALDVLDLLAQHPQGLLIKGISHALRLNLSTCYHLINTLIASGYVERDSATSQLRLGSQIALLGHARVASARFDGWQVARPALHQLTETTQAASYLAAWHEGEAEIQEIVERPDAERIPGLYVGYRGAMHVHALGRTLLAFGAPDVTEPYVRSAFAAADAATQRQHAHLRDLLAAAQRTRHTLDLEELVPQTCCVSAPILQRDNSGTERAVAAIALSLPAGSFLRRREWVVRQVLTTAREIELALAAQSPQPVASVVVHNPHSV